MPLNSGYIDEDMQVYVTVIKNSGLEGTAEADEEYFCNNDWFISQI